MMPREDIFLLLEDEHEHYNVIPHHTTYNYGNDLAGRPSYLEAEQGDLLEKTGEKREKMRHLPFYHLYSIL